ncbi:MAG: alpha/beta hydrolase family protein [Planctomycetota bacterium]|jgi:pimeloyl-ACP methyl ester carboxylesterase
MMRWLAALLLLSLPAGAEILRIKTSDGLEIVGEFHRAKADDAPTVICIPMYRHTRETYRPMLEPLLRKGLNVLNLDMRGHGESAPSMAQKVLDRDPAPFQAMHLDVQAAIDFLEKEKDCDPTRIALIGASVGCSVAVDTTVRRPECVRAVVLLTPGSTYLDVPTLKHLEHWPGTRVFTFTSQEEEPKSREVMDALAAFDASNHLVLPGKKIHGTRMFGNVTAIEELIANFMESSLLHAVDLRVPTVATKQTGFPEGALALVRKQDSATYSFMVCAAGAKLLLGGGVRQPFQGKLTLTVGKQTIVIPLKTDGVAEPEIGGKRSSRVARGVARGITWVALAMEDWKPGVPVALEFRSSKGGRIRFPGGGAAYAVFPQPARLK